VVTGGSDLARPGATTPETPTDAGDEQASARRVVAVVKDLFFVARIRETARLAGVPLVMARTAEELERALGAGPRFVLLDLTAGFDYARLFSAVNPTGIPVLGFTTHALARQTQPWHARCARVVTKETLTEELPVLLRQGVGA
jgi:hypothetical protein